MCRILLFPAWIDRHTEGLRGAQLRITQLHFNAMVKHACDMIHMLFKHDKHFHPNDKFSDKVVCMDELFSFEIMAGFPNLYGVPVQTMPIFLSSMVDQHITRLILMQLKVMASLPMFARFRLLKQVLQFVMIIRCSVKSFFPVICRVTVQL